MKKFKVIASRTSYEYIEIEANSKSEAIYLATNGDEEYDWKYLPELHWEIDSVEGV